MYLEGYEITIMGDNDRFVFLEKLDFAGDKPWTARIWADKIESLRKLQASSYPLIILDLDHPDKEKITLMNKGELNDWIKSTFGMNL